MQRPALLIDHGNSRVKWAVRDGGLTGRGVADCDAIESPEALRGHWQGLGSVRSVVMASVGRARVSAVLEEAAREILGCVPSRVATAREALGVTCGYRDPSQLGVDRWAAIVAAWHRAGGPCCVVDCGSAITIDGVDRSGRHLGGVIVPGARMIRDAFYAATQIKRPAIVPATDKLMPTATDTAGAVWSGARFAATGGVERGVDRLTATVGGHCRLFLCGGDADDIASYLARDWEKVPDLVLEGIGLLGEMTG